MIESQNALDNATPSFAREVSNYQASISKPVSTPATSGDPRFAKELEAYNAAQSRQPTARDEPPAAPSSSREADLAVLTNTYKQVDPRTGRAYGLNPQISGVLERARADVLSGKSLSRDAIAAELAKITGIKPTTQEPAASTEPVDGEGTPAERLRQEQEQAINTILPHIDSEGFIASEHLNPAVLSGYKLPAGLHWEAETTISMLSVARQAGFSQKQIDDYIAVQRRAEGV